ncbi:MAG: hypothetical protein NZ651_06515, partial [Candidatus Bipolaricaulota bacterium]|nr:hypothetical protein [Candidatus Bipolaricaulota bacterium]MDW8127408.1 hypothetical protein [Candidatus Bipolaricaulota bacterium]
MGGLGGLIIGALVFWVYPTVQKARSPIGELVRSPLVLRYPKDSPLAEDVLALAEKLQSAWTEVLATLKIPTSLMPDRIYLYVYSSASEVAMGISARLEEENTPLAVADLLVNHSVKGDLGRLAGTLAFGRPGNALMPRGVALYLDDPGYPWAEEAWTWTDRFSIQEVWSRAEQLLPYDPWEALYFQINAPWASATLTMEKMRTVLTALSGAKRGGGHIAEVFAAAFVEWALLCFGPEELRSLWRATTWESAAQSARRDPSSFAQEFLAFLKGKFESYGGKAHLLALKALHSGQASQALKLLAELDDPPAREIKGLAYLALGEVQEAFALVGHKFPNLEQFISAPRLIDEPIILVGGGSDDVRFVTAAKN